MKMREYDAFCIARLQMQRALHDWLATHPSAADVAQEREATNGAFVHLEYIFSDNS